jgi:hypothetical protein
MSPMGVCVVLRYIRSIDFVAQCSKLMSSSNVPKRRIRSSLGKIMLFDGKLDGGLAMVECGYPGPSRLFVEYLPLVQDTCGS